MNITDPIALLSFLFRGGRGPSCLDAADANDDGALNLTDAVYLLLYIFGGGAPPPDPGPPGRNCGPDPVVPGRLGSLGCALFAGC